MCVYCEVIPSLCVCVCVSHVKPGKVWCVRSLLLTCGVSSLPALSGRLHSASFYIPAGAEARPRCSRCNLRRLGQQPGGQPRPSHWRPGHWEQWLSGQICIQREEPPPPPWRWRGWRRGQCWLPAVWRPRRFPQMLKYVTVSGLSSQCWHWGLVLPPSVICVSNYHPMAESCSAGLDAHTK